MVETIANSRINRRILLAHGRDHAGNSSFGILFRLHAKSHHSTPQIMPQELRVDFGHVIERMLTRKASSQQPSAPSLLLLRLLGARSFYQMQTALPRSLTKLPRANNHLHTFFFIRVSPSFRIVLFCDFFLPRIGTVGRHLPLPIGCNR